MKKEEDTEDDDPIECVGVVAVSSAPTSKSSRHRKLWDNDVIMVHGEMTSLEHPGNAVYRKLINLNRGLYEKSKRLNDQLNISKSIVASIWQDNGRFLERDDGSLIITSLGNVKWGEISDGKAAELTLTALRYLGEKTGNQVNQQF